MVVKLDRASCGLCECVVLVCRHLDLSNDGLTGSIPSGLGSLSTLAVLHLQSNPFSGE